MPTHNIGHDEKADQSIVTDVVELQDSAKDEEAAVSSASTETLQLNFWRSFRQSFPLVGIGCLIGSGVISNIAFFFLLCADETALSEWEKWGYIIHPNVIISILNSVATMCITAAAVQGIAITWWRKAVRGTTIKDLHSTWSFGGDPLFILQTLLKNPKHLNLAALAGVVVKLVSVDSIFYQRALSTYITLGPLHSKNITTYPATSLPVTGRFNTFGNNTDLFTDEFTVDIDVWRSSAYNNIRFTYGFGDCEGICSLNVSAPGYVASCSHTDEEVDIISYAMAHFLPNTTQISTVTDIFNVDFSLNFPTAERNYTWIGVNATSYVPQERNEMNSTQRCPATLLRQQCELRQAMITYPVYLETTNISTRNRNETLLSKQAWLGFVNKMSGTYLSFEPFNYTLKQVPGIQVGKYIDSLANSNSPDYTSDAGIYQALKDRYQSRAYITTYSNDTDWTPSTEAQLAAIMQNNWATEPVNATGCPFQYGDPMDHIISELNMLTFITSYDLTNRDGLDNPSMTEEQAEEYVNRSTKVVEATEQVNEIHFKANIGWMIAALVSSIVCHLLISPLYWGFWRLGRKVTFNPVEIANAFQAPVLATVHPRSGCPEDIVKVAGMERFKHTQVFYGESTKSSKLAPRG